MIGRPHLLRWALLLLQAAGLLGACAAAAAESRAPEMVLVPAGTYAPLQRTKDEPESVNVPAFRIDVRPVTNAEFLDFVLVHPKWARSKVSPLFADAGYLSHWAGDRELGPAAPADAPVVRVSWFAAQAYAAWRGKRLPTTAEWERAASAGFTVEDGRADPQLASTALAWLAQPAPAELPRAGLSQPNWYGVRDLLTLVWEWVEDFNTAMVTGESRADTGLDRALFCGSGSANGREMENYPAYIRAAMRSSLRANYIVPNLGFRCVQNP